MPAKESRVRTNTPGVYRRGKKWLRKLEVPSDDGKRKQRWVTANTRSELDEKVAKIISDLYTGSYAPPSKTTVAEVLDRWLEAVSTQVRPTTLRSYRSNAEKLKTAIGSVPVTQLKADHLRALYAKTMEVGKVTKKPDGSIVRKPITAYVVINMHRVISEALMFAVGANIVRFNVAKAVKPHRKKKKKQPTVDGDGVAQLLAAAEGDDLHALIALDLSTGLRRSELLGLRWCDVDLEGAELYVEQGFHVVKGEGIYEAPKSETSRRPVALPPSACMALRTHRERMEARARDLGAALSPEHHIFVRADFSPMRPDTVSHQFRKLVEKAGIKKLPFKNLRHSHATILLEQGIHPKIVSDRLGHASIHITLDLYSHPGMDLQKKAAEAFDVAINESRAGETQSGERVVTPA